MSLPAIGVVIPCYKAEHTLRQTVESVLQGAPDNLQLVLVEDGSPDGTGALCDALAAQDPRVTALHQPNGGASAARNAGLDTLCRSGAEWVLFVDADDTLLPGLWQALPLRAQQLPLSVRPGEDNNKACLRVYHDTTRRAHPAVRERW